MVATAERCVWDDEQNGARVLRRGARGATPLFSLPDELA
jgi:hypothetical protein